MADTATGGICSARIDVRLMQFNVFAEQLKRHTMERRAEATREGTSDTAETIEDTEVIADDVSTALTWP